MSTTVINPTYMLFEDNFSPESINFEADNIANSVVSDQEITDKQKSHFAEILEGTAKKIRDVIKRQESMTQESDISPIDDDVVPDNFIPTSDVKHRRIPRYVSENIFLITFVWQLICVAGLEAVDGLTWDEVKRKEKWYFFAGILIMVILQLVNMIACLAVTIKLFKQYRHNNTSMKFLLHCYIAILFLFGGVYTFIAWVFPETFQGVRDFKSSKVRTLDLYSQLVYMSISTGTLCGSAGITASNVITEMLMSLQMLLSFLYFTSILSEVTLPVKSKRKMKITTENNLSNDTNPAC